MIDNKNMECLLCGKTAELLEANFPGYQEPEKYGIYYCSFCNTSFAFPRGDTKHIYENIYKHADKLPGYDRYTKYMNVVKTHKNPLQYLAQSEEMYWAVKCALEQGKSRKDTLRIIEIGCGLGYLTYSLIQDGYGAIGLDISQNAIDEATKNFGNHYICADITEYAKQHLGAYDVVILTEVIEHVENPVHFLKSAMLLIDNKSEEGGRILLTTPNKTIFRKNIVWQTDLPPVHLWWFSEDSMRYIANKLNANTQFLDFTDYYKKKPAFIDTKTQKSSQSIKHIFDKKGKIIKQIDDNAKSPLKKLRSFAVQWFVAKYLYHKIKRRHYMAGKRSLVLGVVLDKK
jgi:2-polyprenyl-3-methyl-5-hydroxy-6-metoxy-1,4-benzoquinol methylase